MKCTDGNRLVAVEPNYPVGRHSPPTITDRARRRADEDGLGRRSGDDRDRVGIEMVVMPMRGNDDRRADRRRVEGDRRNAWIGGKSAAPVREVRIGQAGSPV